MKGKYKLTIKTDWAKEIRKLSRNIFKDSQRGTQVHKNAKVYTRKAKHRKGEL